MRKYIKKQLLEMLSTMKEAGILSERLCAEGQLERSRELLVQQQEAAVHIGETVEQTEGEGHNAVEALEEHCELLWQCAQAENKTQYSRAYKSLHQGYSQLEKRLKEEIAEQYEILFLPYKASMWDSLESVWLAAREDPDCRCYVMPIPYYDRNPDGSFSTIHCEADLYPSYVPITDYRQYDFQRHPDVIFIHNPYDHGNCVTSVHPDFYSERLKRYTDMLVYIPYFIAVDDVQEHLCISSGVKFADQVIVQSEKVKETYIKTIRKFEKENDCKGLFGDLKQKIQALGSPKIDKVLNTKREDVELPEAWKQLIYQADGSRKKVLLYNTSIAMQLEYEEEFIAKIRYVIDIMKNWEDTVLWWRPHPLALTTYSSMRPDLEHEYIELVETYKEECWGIYDDTPDMNRAIAVSDAYYGDSGSLLELYKVTGKPILVQEVSINQTDK